MSNSKVKQGNYIKDCYKTGELRESVIGSRALTEFLNLVAEEDGSDECKKHEDVGIKIHQIISKYYIKDRG